MFEMVTLNDFNLKDDPFPTAPPKEIVWADREDFARQLKSAIKRSLISSPSRIIAAIWGDWGAGKSHAMRYFSKPDVMQSIIDELDCEKKQPAISIPIVFPLGNVADIVYLEIVEKIGIEQIIKALDSLEPEGKTVRPTKVLIEKVSEVIDPRVAEAFVALKGKSPFIFQQYLSMTASATELRKLGVARGIETASDKIRTISAILNLLTSTTTSRVFLWFDDLERIGDIPGKDIYGFQYLIRDLLDNVPSNLVIIFNMTLLSGEKVEDRLLFLGDAVRFRISDTITVKPFTKEEFLTYIGDLMSFYRKKPMKKEERLFPFEVTALEFIFSELGRRGIPLEPRNVNEAMSSILFEMTTDKTKRDPIIDRTYIINHIASILSRISLPKK